MNKSDRSEATGNSIYTSKNYDKSKRMFPMNSNISVKTLQTKPRSITSKCYVKKEVLKKSPRDHSDPSRRKLNYFELKPHERPNTKLEVLKRLNKYENAGVN